MITLLSPAKALNFDKQNLLSTHTLPDHLDKSEQLIKKLQRLSKKKIADLMDLSEKLTQLNYERYLTWSPDFNAGNSKQAILAFDGDVYTGLDAKSLKEADLLYAQDHLRILSGLHGLLRPLDLIKPYRLEMGTRLSGRGYKNITEFWTNEITKALLSLLNEEDVLVNLSSNEYFKAVNKKKLNSRIITPVFKDFKNGTYKSIFLYVKQARGMMARFIVKNRIEQAEELKSFEDEGYFYNDPMSDENTLVFTRG